MKRFLRTSAVIILLASPGWTSPLLNGGSGKGCGVGGSRFVSLPVSVDLPNVYTGNNPDPVSTAMKAWGEYVMRVGSGAQSSSKAQAELRRVLLAAANANAMSWPKGWSQGDDRPPSVIYHTMETLFPALVAYGQNKEAFSKDEQAIFEDWAGDIIDRLGKTEKIRGWKTDNKKYQYGALSAAYGVITGKGKYLNTGVKIYKTAINSMRKDGSLPGDTERGGSSLHYTNLAIANLVVIAEFASDGGIDLYSYGSGNKSIHTAISFLVAAQENPSLIAQYAVKTGAKTGSFKGYSAEKQDRRWASEEKASWGYYYLRRFGKSATGQSLREVAPFLRAGKAGVFSQAGGNARCFVSG
jgi:poly(beta-D-mannuronate) lyase